MKINFYTFKKKMEFTSNKFKRVKKTAQIILHKFPYKKRISIDLNLVF
jgi:hypothetical protein